MERIHCGWLTKSPQQGKTSGPWKLFHARWRRRFFVLYAPPASTLLPGTCSAVLDYYDNDRQLFKKGTIDLTNCVEVELRPDIEVYKNVFSLRTKHRGRDRTYHLFSDSEEDMKHWVQCLRAVLFLDGTNASGRDAFVHSPSDSTPARSVPCERYISFPGHAVLGNSSTESRQPSNPSSPSHSTGSSARCPSPSMAFESQSHDDNSDQYILLEECFSGPSSQKSSASSSVAVPPTHQLSSMTKQPVQLKSNSADGQGYIAHSTVGSNHQHKPVSDSHLQAANYFNLSDVSNSGDAHSKPATSTHSGHYATVIPQATHYSNWDELRLPTKKGGMSTSSSDTDDSSNESDDSLTSKLPPPVPGRHGNADSAVNYLDLDHGLSADEGGPGKSPGSRSSIGGSDYKEIDWVKTKALHDTRKAVENKRKGSEKSMDG